MLQPDRQEFLFDCDSSIYVAGHHGMVGSAIVRRLKALGFEQIITRTHSELDLTDQRTLREFFHSQKIDHVILAAAKVGGIHANNTCRADFIYQNLMIECNVIHEAFRAGVKRLLFLGSSCIYPKHAPQPMREESLLTGPLEPTNEPYAIAKIAGIKLCESYNRQYGTHYRAVMPTNLYGPHDNFDLEASHVLPALIRKLHLGKLALAGDWGGIAADEEARGSIPTDLMASLTVLSKSAGYNLPEGLQSASATPSPAGILIWGSGTPKREFLHVDDMAASSVFVMSMSDDKWDRLTASESQKYGLAFINIGTGMDLTIAELTEMIRDVVGYSGELVYDQTKPDGTPRKLLDVSRLRSACWQLKIPLREGIADTYAWYKVGRGSGIVPEKV